jgi:YfiH family protein
LVEVIRADALSGVPHGFLGRRGGVSVGAVAGLNVGLGSADDPAAVIENRRRAAQAVLPGARLATCYQVHSAICVEAGAWADAQRPHADALVTNREGIVLGVLTADCAPVLFADVENGVVGAAHAGWRGAFTGVCEATVEAMVGLGARREKIAAAIGPCIAQKSYEVDDAFRARFAAQAGTNERHFAPGREGHYQFDLEAYVADRLGQSGIGSITPLGLDTYGEAERFYSFRRATHAAQADYGRQIALIGRG